MIALQIDRDYLTQAIENKLTAAAQAALDHAGAEGDLSILVTSDEQVRQLNARHRDIDEATDVLSFPSDEANPESGTRYWGDIAIAYPVAEAQARGAGHPVEAELQLLAVHGTLHLLGHDHAGEDEKAAMWAAQRQILDALGLDIGWDHAEAEHD